MGPRISAVQDPNPEQSALLEKTLFPGLDEPLNVFATLAHHPELLRRVNALGGLFMARPSISVRQRELVILRVAVRCKSVYELAQHVPIARRAGLSDDELERVKRLDDSGWEDNDLVILRAVDDLLDRDTVEDPHWRDLAACFTSSQLLELLFLVGFYRMLAGYLRAVRVPVEGLAADLSIDDPGWT